MKYILLIYFILISFNVYAWQETDSFCLNQCLDNGYSYSYCSNKCSYDTRDYTNPYSIGYDYTCMKECLDDGQSYSECREICK